VGVDEEVVGLDVAVHKAARVQVRQRVEQLDRKLHRLLAARVGGDGDVAVT
jgi:hypothetical protein